MGNFFSKIGLGNTYFLIGIAILLSWLGMEKICRYVWLAVWILGIIEICSIDVYMKNDIAITFLLSSFVGLVFFFKYEDDLIFNQFKSMGEKVSELIPQIEKDGKQIGENLTYQIQKQSDKQQNKIQEERKEKIEVISENKISQKNIEN